MAYAFEDYVTRARAQSDEVAALVAACSDETLRRRPGPTSWSAGECIVHLTLTTPPYVAAIDTAVSEARARVRSPFFPLLRTSADESFRILLAHNRRHLWQARRALEAPAAPDPVPC